MNTLRLLSVAALLLFLLPAAANALEQNMGVIEHHHLGYIAGNSNSEHYDYVLIFKQHTNDAYRVIADIEREIENGPDRLWRIGSLDGCVVATIQSGYSAGQIRSHYARSSYDASLCKVMSKRQFNSSDLANDVHFGDRSIAEFCRGVADRPAPTQHRQSHQTHAHQAPSRKCQAPGQPGTMLKSGATNSYAITGGQDEYWFCIDSPGTEFTFDIEARDRNDMIRMDLQLFDADFSRVDTSSSSHGRGGSNYSVEAEYGGPKGHIYALEPGRYMLRISLSRAKPEGAFTLLYRQRHL